MTGQKTEDRNTAPAASDSRDLPLDQLRPHELEAQHWTIFQRDIAWLRDRKDRFVDVVCPACGNDAADHALEKFSLSFVRCRSCETLYMCPRPSAALMAEYYATAEHYRFWAQHYFPRTESVRRERVHRPWLEQILARCDALGVGRGTLLEVGPGFGTFCQLATESGAFRRVVAIEPTPDLAAACRERGVEVIERPVEEVQTEIGDVDVLVAFEVIEHLFDPHAFLEKCARLLRPGGLAVISCPSGQGFDVVVLGPESVTVDNEHVNLFNPGSLGHLIERCGLEVLDIRTPGRLDAELVRTAIEEGRFDVSAQPFLEQVLVNDWDRMAAPFQRFLAENGLSSHMMAYARRPAVG